VHAAPALGQVDADAEAVGTWELLPAVVAPAYVYTPVHVSVSGCRDLRPAF
jgi:hypothetical protein